MGSEPNQPRRVHPRLLSPPPLPHTAFPQVRRRLANEVAATLTVAYRGDLDAADRALITAPVPLSPEFSSAFNHVPGHAPAIKARLHSCCLVCDLEVACGDLRCDSSTHV